MEQEVFIVAARRTPIGVLNGALAKIPAHELGARAARAALSHAGLDPTQVDELIMGQVLTTLTGMNPARQAARGAGLPDAATAFCLNQVCGSGLRAVALGAQQIALRDAEIIVAGGQESMSLAPHAALLRSGRKFGNIDLVDTAANDGLTDAFSGKAMGVTAENIVRQYAFSREAQDCFALESQRRANAAQRSGLFASEIVTVDIPGRELPFVEDEAIRPNTSMEKLAALPSVFQRDGSVTAGNSSGINDGAAALVLTSRQSLGTREPLARIAGWATAGVDPELMGLGPIPATRKALSRIGWSVQDVDVWEVNEAFAAQGLAVMQELDLDPAKTNVNGGAIALGHPIGASGARVLVTLLHQMVRMKARRGVATLCIGGGMGIALCLER